jgi:hypothetical protein
LAAEADDAIPTTTATMLATDAAVIRNLRMRSLLADSDVN